MKLPLACSCARGRGSKGDDGGGEMKDIVGDEAAKYRVCEKLVTVIWRNNDAGTAGRD